MDDIFIKKQILLLTKEISNENIEFSKKYSLGFNGISNQARKQIRVNYFSREILDKYLFKGSNNDSLIVTCIRKGSNAEKSGIKLYDEIIEIDGNFDDCQNLVKSMFADKKFSSDIKMSGVNSINWARIIAQSVYYFYSYLSVEDASEPTNFSVPTGNFGDVYAGYLAKKMGLPIDKLIVATNQNDILHRAISKGSYEAEKVSETISPSMDIQIASNFERLIFDLNNGDDQQTSLDMKNIKEKGQYLINDDKLNKISENFLSARMSEDETLEVIKKVYEKYSVVLDPHTAIGYGAFDKHNLKGNNIVLATAHPCKFPDAVSKAINLKSDLPKELEFILNEKEDYDIVENNLEKIKNYITGKTK